VSEGLPPRSQGRNGRAHLLGGRAKPLAGYPHAREANGFIFVSGISSRRPDDTVEGIGDIGAQTRAVIENVRFVLRAAGADLDCLVSITTYLVDMDDYADYNLAYNEHFTAESGPARTTVAVKALPGPDLLIEMSAIALAPGTVGP